MQRSTQRSRRTALKWLVLVMLLGGAVLLLPRLERYLVISACPIAYVSEDGRVHLTNESGTIHVELEGPTAAARVGRPYLPPAWSPTGTYVAYQCLDAWAGTSHVAVLNPWSGERWVHPNESGGRFGGWAEDEAWLEGTCVRDARTGAALSDAFDGEPPLRPAYIPEPAAPLVLCGFAPDGNLLANVRGRAGWGLVVLDSEAKVRRRIVSEVRPMEASGASWRGATR
jgi:hypothetical protein